MQIVCAVAAGINFYLENPNCLDTDTTRCCPLCPDGHRLRGHAWYARFLELPGQPRAVVVTIRRFLCPRTGRTVSLLPDFCIPRRQIGPAILGLFLHALVTSTLEIGGALARAMGHAVARTTAQSLLRGFLRRESQIRAYLSSLDARTPAAEPPPLARRGPLAQLVTWLLHSACDPATACIDHGRDFHKFAALGLA